LLFALAITLLCGLIFGTAPAWRAMSVNLVEALKLGARSSGWSGGTRLRWSLVSVQVALSGVLLIGAGLMIRTLWELGQVDPGFRPDNLLAMNMYLPGGKFPDEVKLNAFIERALDKTRSAGGIESAAAIWPLSLTGPSWTPPINFENEPRPAGQEPWVQAAVVTPDYFQTMRIPVRAGRTFTPADRFGATLVAVVTQEFAQRFFSGKNPLGQRVKMAGAVGVKGWAEIVGVVGNTLRGGLAGRPGPELYWAFAQYPLWFPTLLIRTQSDPRGFAQGLPQRVAALDSDMVVQNPQAMTEVLAGTVADRRFLRLMLALFAGLALTLTVVGIYGAAAYLVSQRMQELGIRVALGASGRDVIGLVLRQGMVPVAAGVVLGSAAALGLTSFIASRLYAVKATDPLTFVSVGLLLALTALGSCWLPARRASRVDPMVALRCE
jgi:putative ABC transport system permease protein